MNKGLCPKCRKIISSSSRVCQHCGLEITLNSIPVENRIAYPLKNARSHYSGLFLLQALFCIVGGILLAIGFVVGSGISLLGIIIMLLSIPFGMKLNRHWLQMLLEHDYAMLSKEEKVQLENEGITKQHEQKAEQSESYSSADELKKYKELWDSGVITQEEFEAKKAQLLGL